VGLNGGGNLRYTQIQRKEYGPFVTIGEYVQFTDPGTYAKLVSFIGRSKMRDITELIIAAADIFGASKHFQRVMTERPRPGRGGLLPGENEGALTFLR
jgi:hypothetical protein